MAYTFVKAQGNEIGTSLVDDTKLDYCKEMIEKAKKLGKKLLLPVDAVITDHFPDPIDDPTILITSRIRLMIRPSRPKLSTSTRFRLTRWAWISDRRPLLFTVQK